MNKIAENERTIRFVKLSDQNEDAESKFATPSERWAMMWQLALDAWAFKGEKVAEPKLQRRIIRAFRRDTEK